ncbi:MAG: phosphocholine cytidylyltransferase family protein [Proteobacteria bacterium]|nr:phosphocholine cytidylyltransferase family protein [Pseudomonadota bacterium]
MPMRTACILAAGRGTRLGAFGQMRPKGFIEVGGAPIVVRSVERLRRAGIERVVVVTGHQADWYAELDVERVHNAEFAHTGSLRSLACAREALAGEETFLLLESDLVYEQRALEALLVSPHESAIVVSGPTGAGDEVWVAHDEGRLVSMSKDPGRLSSGPHAELVGISRISRALFEALLEIDRESGALAYETDGLVRCAGRFDIGCVMVTDLRWGEIDDEAHLARAHHVHDEIVRMNA